MPSIEFDLARLTAQSQGLKPKLPGGAAPSLTKEDIALCAALVRNTFSYHLVLAKYCQDEMSIVWAMNHLKKLNWTTWFDKRRTGRTDLRTMGRVAELSFLEFLSPATMTKRGTTGRAGFVKVDRRTWQNVYQEHHHEVTAHLFALESDALEQIRKRLR